MIEEHTKPVSTLRLCGGAVRVDVHVLGGNSSDRTADVGLEASAHLREVGKVAGRVPESALVLARDQSEIADVLVTVAMRDCARQTLGSLAGRLEALARWLRHETEMLAADPANAWRQDAGK